MKSSIFTSASIFLLSGAALAYEVILVRLLSITRFHHLAFMVLSLVLLAYGASGVLVAYLRAMLLRAFRLWFCLFAGMFAVGTVVCFQLSQHIPVYPDQWLWSPLEAINLVALYLVLSLPFFAAACAVGLAYCAMRIEPGGIYRADLSGAAVGSLGALATLWLPGGQGLWLPWSAGFSAAAVMALGIKKRFAVTLLLSAILAPLLCLMSHPKYGSRLVSSTDKPLSIALNAHGAQKMADIFTPLGRITLIRNTIAPFRHAPGLSLSFSKPVAAQWGAFIDGDTFEPILPAPSRPDPLAYLDYLPDAMTYRIKSHPEVLVLGTPFTTHLARALTRNASRIDVVVSNPGWRSLLDHAIQDTTGRYLIPPTANLNIGAPRGFLRAGEQQYDLIYIGPPDPSALTADYLHTVEAFNEALARLKTGGIIAVGGPSDLPPRAGLRLLSTAATALKSAGLKVPSDSLVFFRSLQTVHIWMKNEPLTPVEISAIRNFCQDRKYDLVWFPGITRAEVNQWNRIDAPRFHEAAKQLLGPEAEAFQKKYKFDISPVFDDRPYFSRFIKPSALKEIIDMRGSGALGLLSYAEPVLAATLGQAVLLSVLVVWLPLRRFRPSTGKPSLSALFFMSGAGFMLVEYAFLEKMNLFLNEPVLAVGVTLAVFLAMAGLGGGCSARLAEMFGHPMTCAGMAAIAATLLVIIYIFALPSMMDTLPGRPLAIRMALAMTFTAPLALVMGIPFPLAVSALKHRDTASVPWAWGLNGFGALIGPVLGISLAVYGGIATVMTAAAVCYAVVFLVAMRQH
jgi:hypothetical protein